MKLSTTTLFYGPRPDGSVAPMLESIRRIHRAGFRDLDLNFAWTRRHKTELFYQDWREWIQECRSLIGELGMTVSQSHAPFYNVIDPNYPYREEEEEMVRRSIIASSELGAGIVVIHGGSLPYCPDYRKNKRENIEYLKPHLELAAEYGAEGLAPCPMMKAGQVFLADYAKPEGFCDEAWKAVYQYVFALAHGGDGFAFYHDDWMREPGCAIVSCNDGLRPVIMKLEATDLPAELGYEPVR